MQEIVLFDANPSVAVLLAEKFSALGLKVNAVSSLESVESALKACASPLAVVLDLSRQPEFLIHLQSFVSKYVAEPNHCFLTSVEPKALSRFLPNNITSCFFGRVVERPFKTNEFVQLVQDACGISTQMIPVPSSNVVQAGAQENLNNKNADKNVLYSNDADVDDILDSISVKIDVVEMRRTFEEMDLAVAVENHKKLVQEKKLNTGLTAPTLRPQGYCEKKEDSQKPRCAPMGLPHVNAVLANIDSDASNTGLTASQSVTAKVVVSPKNIDSVTARNEYHRPYPTIVPAAKSSPEKVSQLLPDKIDTAASLDLQKKEFRAHELLKHELIPDRSLKTRGVRLADVQANADSNLPLRNASLSKTMQHASDAVKPSLYPNKPVTPVSEKFSSDDNNIDTQHTLLVSTDSVNEALASSSKAVKLIPSITGTLSPMVWVDVLRKSHLTGQRVTLEIGNVADKTIVIIDTGCVIWAESTSSPVNAAMYLKSLSLASMLPIDQIESLMKEGMDLSQALKQIGVFDQVLPEIERTITASIRRIGLTPIEYRYFDGYSSLAQKLVRERPVYHVAIAPMIFDLSRSYKFVFATLRIRKFIAKTWRTQLNSTIDLSDEENSLLSLLDTPQTLDQLEKRTMIKVENILPRLLVFDFVDMVV